LFPSVIRPVALFLSLTIGVAAPAGSLLFAQSAAGAAQTAGLVDITLERKKDGKVETMAAGHVFEPGDVIRLRLQSHYSGFLYVMNQGSSGQFATVFPAADTGSDNRVLAEKQYLVPAVEEGWFEVQGPPGFDTLYFLLSPTPLASPSLGSFVAPVPKGSLKPRCNDKIFRARGECMDDSAGPAAVPPGASLPKPLEPMAGSASRDIVFVKKSGEQTVGVAGPPSAPVLYTFRLAHK
jgi:hypothetical protein